MKIELKTTWNRLTRVDPSELVCYAISTCWWCLLRDHPGYQVQGLPADPRGSMLMQAPIGPFLKSAEANEAHYGKYGLKAFMSAYHGNLVTDDGRPTSFEGWKKYEELLDAQENS